MIDTPKFKMELYKLMRDRTVSRTDIQEAFVQSNRELYEKHEAKYDSDELLCWFCDNILPQLLKSVESWGIEVNS